MKVLSARPLFTYCCCGSKIKQRKHAYKYTHSQNSLFLSLVMLPFSKGGKRKEKRARDISACQCQEYHGTEGRKEARRQQSVPPHRPGTTHPAAPHCLPYKKKTKPYVNPAAFTGWRPWGSFRVITGENMRFPMVTSAFTKDTWFVITESPRGIYSPTWGNIMKQV